MTSVWKIISTLLLSGAELCGFAFAGPVQSRQQITLNGLAFTLPEGYAKHPGAERANSIFLYNQKFREGMVVLVPATPFVEQEVIDNLLRDTQKRFFPKETQPYQWKSTNLLRKVSQFEVKDTLEKGLNPNHLLLFEYRHVVFNQRDVFVATIFEARKGKPAAEMFNDDVAAASMTTCRASADLIYSLTGEKIDPDRPPCELLANVP